MDLVLDTNFLIDHLSWLIHVQNYLESDPIARVVIPYVVIQELDGLKQRLDSAKEAISFILSAVKSKKCVHISKLELSLDNNDDLILETALHCKNKSNHVILCSNDNNLCIKALVHSLKTVSKPLIKPLEFYFQLKGLVNNSVVELGVPRVLEEMEIDTDLDEMISESRLQDTKLDYILYDLIILTETTLNPLFYNCLEKVYGKDSNYLKQWPWNIKDLFKILLDHELVAFTFIKWSKLSNSKSQLRNMAKDLERSVRFQKTLVTVGDLLLFIKDLEIIFLEIPPSLGQESFQNLSRIKESLLQIS